MNYSAELTSEQNVAIIYLTDRASSVEVSILPSLGNRVYRMKVHGEDILYYPPGDLSGHVKNPVLGGIPFLAPWADLLDEQAFWANGTRYGFNMELGNVLGARPIHGLLAHSPFWQAMKVNADRDCASVTSRLEFWKYPDLMAQWPFAHEYEIEHRLSDGVLEVATHIKNLSVEPMPVAAGFHPYFQIPGVAREEWTAHLPARVHVIAGEHQIPTGEMRPLDIPNPLPLGGWTWTTDSRTWSTTPMAARVSRLKGRAGRSRFRLGRNIALRQSMCPRLHPRGTRNLSALSRWQRLSVVSIWRTEADIPICNTCRRATCGARISG